MKEVAARKVSGMVRVGTKVKVPTPGPFATPGRFMQELTEMLGFRPYRFYFYMWKFVSPLCMAVLTTASIIQLGVTPPGYSAWIKEEVRGAPHPHKPQA